jgi:hypothetical protein
MKKYLFRQIPLAALLSFFGTYLPTTAADTPIEIKSRIVCGKSVPLLVWRETYQNGSTSILFSPVGGRQRYSLSGGSENAFDPAAIPVTDSSFMCVWQSYDRYKGGSIDAAILSPYKGVERRWKICDYDGADKYHPCVAPSAESYLIFWQDAKPGDYDILGTRFLPDANTQPAFFRINSDTSRLSQYYPEAGWTSDHILVVWHDVELAHNALWGQYLKFTGEKEGDNFRISPESKMDQTEPAVASHGQRIAVVWQEAKAETSYIKMRYFNKLTAGTVIDVSDSATLLSKSNARCAFFHDEKLVVLWMDQRSGKIHIYAQLFGRQGTRIGNNFEIERLNSILDKLFGKNLMQNSNPLIGSNDQFLPDVSVDEKGELFASWTEAGANGVSLRMNVDSLNWTSWVAAEYRDVIKRRFWLQQPAPSPFRTMVHVQFEVPLPGKVVITVLNAAGREVVKLANGSYFVGTHTILWNGRDNLGNVVASGTYYVMMSSADFRMNRKVIKL